MPINVPRRLSPSALERLRSCPKAFRYQYIERAEGEDRPSPILVVGNAVHHALERFYGLPDEHRTPEILRRALRAVWPQHRTTDVFIDTADEAAAGAAALEMLDGYSATHDLHARPKAREEWLRCRLPNGFELFGKVDRIDASAQGLAVWDYKTGKRALTERDLAESVAAQIYSLAVAETYREPVSEFRLVYLALGRDVVWHPTPEDLSAARERLIAITSELEERDDFEATPGPACRYCPYGSICPDKDAVRIDDIELTEDIPF